VDEDTGAPMVASPGSRAKAPLEAVSNQQSKVYLFIWNISLQLLGLRKLSIEP
jgi:hypothetical protein